MSSRDIAEVVDSRHDDVKRSILRLSQKGIIQLPPLAEVKNHLGQTVSEYLVSKRDSYVVVAQLSPEFTARLVDCWQELEAQAVAAALPDFSYNVLAPTYAQLIGSKQELELARLLSKNRRD